MRKLIKNISFFSYNSNATKDLTNEVKISKMDLVNFVKDTLLKIETLGSIYKIKSFQMFKSYLRHILFLFLNTLSKITPQVNLFVINHSRLN